MNRSLLLTLAALAAALHAGDNPYSADARQSYALVKDSLLKAADRMPTEDYSFRTTPKVRTFAEMISHVAAAQMLMCGVVKGEKSIANPQFNGHRVGSGREYTYSSILCQTAICTSWRGVREPWF